MKKLIAGGGAVFGALSWAAVAVAGQGGATLSGYDRPAEIQTHVQGAVASKGGVLGATNTVGSLPFTGVDLGIIVGVALILLALGWSLRRAGKHTA